MPSQHKPSNTDETGQNRYDETTATLQKIENAGYKCVSIWRCEFRKLFSENPGFENELCSHSYVKILQ